jgi:hypothetical protein
LFKSLPYSPPLSTAEASRDASYKETSVAVFTLKELSCPRALELSLREAAEAANFVE